MTEISENESLDKVGTTVFQNGVNVEDRRILRVHLALIFLFCRVRKPLFRLTLLVDIASTGT